MNSILKQMTGEELLALCAFSGRAVFDAVDAELDSRAKAARTRRLSEGRQGAACRRIGVQPAISLPEAA